MAAIAVSREFCALRYVFRVRTEGCTPALVEHLERLYGAFPAPTGALARGKADEIVIRRTGRTMEVSASTLTTPMSNVAASTLDLVMWHVNQRAVASVRDRLLFHASATVSPTTGGAVLCPATSGSGKTTLAATMVIRGWGYLTDEAASVSSDGSVPPTCEAYPKPLSIGIGSQAVAAVLRPKIPAALRAYRGGEWLAPVERVCAVAPIAAVVTPRYTGRRRSRLTPVRPSEAVRLLVENSFNFRDRGDEWLGAVADIARHAPAAELEVGDDGRAPDLLARFVEAAG